MPDDVLRRAPSRAALATVGAAISPGSRVGTIRRLRGGIASGMHAVNFVGPDGSHQWVVVRRYGQGRIAEDPQVAEREWAVLTALARVGAPTPRPLWLDTSGSVFGCPSIVTNRLPGRGLLAPRDLSGWVRQLAEALAQIHAAPLTADEFGLLVDQHAELDRYLLPAQTPDAIAAKPFGPEVWSAVRQCWPTIDRSAPLLVHGDYWPGNTLWLRGRLSGVVDWEQARRGDPVQDVACCRLDLTLLCGPEAADQFVQEYERASQRPVRQRWFWELLVASWALGDVEEWVKGYHDLGRTDVEPATARRQLERFAEAALAQAALAQAAQARGG